MLEYVYNEVQEQTALYFYFREDTNMTICRQTERGVNMCAHKTPLFSNKDLVKIIVPLFLEQLLVVLVGVLDTLIISYAEESAVAGVSLVNQFNTIFIYLFIYRTGFRRRSSDQPVYRFKTLQGSRKSIKSVINVFHFAFYSDHGGSAGREHMDAAGTFWSG